MGVNIIIGKSLKFIYSSHKVIIWLQKTWNSTQVVWTTFIKPFCSLTTCVPHELLLYGKNLTKCCPNVLQALSGWLFGAVCGADVSGIR